MMTTFFLRMLLGHLIGDFMLQPLWLALAKRKGWQGLIIHVAIVTLTTTVLIWGTVPNWLFWMGVLFVVHLFIDQFRTFVFTDNSNGKGVLLLLLDQLVHVVSIAIISQLATGESFSTLGVMFSFPSSSVNTILILFSLVVIAVWVAPILEIEIVVAVLSVRDVASDGGGSGKVVPIHFSDRFMGAVERLLSLFLVLTSLGLLVPLIFLPRLLWLLRTSSAEGRLVTYLKMGTSFVTVLLMGVLLWNANLPRFVNFFGP